MSGKIAITGGDEADYEAGSGLSSRLMEFPDGLTRHITLTAPRRGRGAAPS
jgi:hypothetical protein